MPQSLANILVHLVFSTKDRAAMLDDVWRDELHGYIGGIIHLFLPLPRTVTVADLVKEIKTGATKWIQEKDPRLAGFHWQAGYDIFSVSPGHKEAVIPYIAGHPEHHRTVSFQDEYRGLLEKYAIQYDEH